MKDKASKLQKLANDYELLARVADKAARRYPQSDFAQETIRYGQKSQVFAGQARAEAFRDSLEENYETY
ncbi:MAG: hypothetical protein ACYT04_56770 [Nostoc sp.]